LRARIPILYVILSVLVGLSVVTAEEFEIMKKHTTKAANTLRLC
jgi:hypothetical protein